MKIVRPKRAFSWRSAAPFVVGAAAAGVAVVLAIFAAGTPIAFEAESGTLATGATAVTASDASGGSALKFGNGSDGGTRTCPAYPLPPNASCTGVPVGTSLTTVNGGMITSSDGQKIDGKLIEGDLIVQNKNVTVTNSRIIGRIANNSSGLTVTDSDVGLDSCQTPAYEDGDFNNFDGTNYTMIRTHVHNSGADLTGMGGTGTILIQDSIINQACYYDGDHLDAIQFYSPGDVGNVTINHSFLDSRAVNVSALGNSAIFWADTPGSGSRLTVNQSFLAGGNYTAALYDAKTGSGVVLDIHNTTFIKNSYQYGPCAASNSVQFDGTSGIKFTNNVLDDGTPVSGC